LLFIQISKIITFQQLSDKYFSLFAVSVYSFGKLNKSKIKVMRQLTLPVPTTGGGRVPCPLRQRGIAIA
jgi:hypothetical protein